MIKKSPWWQGTRCVFFFFSNLSKTGPNIAIQFVVAVFCVDRQNLLMKQNDFSSFALMIRPVFFAQGQCSLFLNIKVRKNTLTKKRKTAFPVREAAGDPGALSLLIMCLEIPGRQQIHFLPTASGPLLQWQRLPAALNFHSNRKKNKQKTAQCRKFKPIPFFFFIWNLYSKRNHMRKQRQTQWCLLVIWLRTPTFEAFCYARNYSLKWENWEKWKKSELYPIVP